ncbi:hypothetical protein ABN028_30470 [Actinopolymorpha sp. B17G11]|uniref:hypothetical protein n=1 Tax=Actinopolymorpha sp. B17G11 TaxID=3160861 RepID=UPI0032E3B722
MGDAFVGVLVAGLPTGHRPAAEHVGKHVGESAEFAAQLVGEEVLPQVFDEDAAVGTVGVKDPADIAGVATAAGNGSESHSSAA